jgi:hypothetical protein
LIVTASHLTGSENVESIFFNLDPALDPTKLRFDESGGGDFNPPAIYTGANAFKARGDGKYDVLFRFATANRDASRFSAGDRLTCLITGISCLDAASFVYQSFPSGGNGPFTSAAHVQRIGPDDASGWLSARAELAQVPEPQSAALFGIAMLSYCVRRLWQHRRRSTRRWQ